MTQSDWEAVWAAIDELWQRGVAVVRLWAPIDGWEWMAYGADGDHADRLGVQMAHGATLADLLKKLEAVE